MPSFTIVINKITDKNNTFCVEKDNLERAVVGRGEGGRAFSFSFSFGRGRSRVRYFGEQTEHDSSEQLLIELPLILSERRCNNIKQLGLFNILLTKLPNFNIFLH